MSEIDPRERAIDWPTRFEAWWATSPYRKREVNDYSMRKVLAWEGFWAAVQECSAAPAPTPEAAPDADKLRHECAKTGLCSDVTDGCACSDAELLRRASPIPEQAGVGVKGLEWGPLSKPSSDILEAYTAFGPYRVWGSGSYWYYDFNTGSTAGPYASQVLAKGAAQADYEQRIRSTLIPASPTEPAVPSSPPASGEHEEFVLVPRELTEAMWNAFFVARDDLFPKQMEVARRAGNGWKGMPVVVWAAMLAAAPNARDGR